MLGITAKHVYPKVVPVLTEAQQKAKEESMRIWHENLPENQLFRRIEQFNHGWVAKLPPLPPSHRRIRTLEVGAGIGEHARWENLSNQDYHFLESRSNFCEILKQRFPDIPAICGDIQHKQPFEAGYFDRIIAIHVLEHIPNLPAALQEMSRLLTPSGFLDLILPCEGGLGYSLGRRFSSQRFFETTWNMDYGPIIATEHLSTLPEIAKQISKQFSQIKSSWFPFFAPTHHVNLCFGARFEKLI